MHRCAVIALWLALLSWSMAACAAATAEARLDRDTVHLGETVTLQITVTGDRNAQAPSFGALTGDFAVGGRSQSTRIQIRNGKTSATHLWGVELRPLHQGTITIPRLDVAGTHTDPLKLTVLAPEASNVGKANSPGNTPARVFVETTIAPTTAWVGQQLKLSVRLFHDGALQQGTLDTPDLAGAEVRQVGDDLRYRVERGGRSYEVLERRYAVTPHQPGQLAVPSVGFVGALASGPFAGFFGRGQTVQAGSMPHTVEIKPMPATVDKDTWLPARDVGLRLSGLPETGAVTAGEPLTLTLTATVHGQPFDALPELAMPAMKGARVYPDRPSTSTSDDNGWLVGTRQRKFAVIPTAPGPLTIPTIRLPWWNVKSGQAELAQTASTTLQVLPGTVGTKSPALPVNGGPEPASAPAAQTRDSAAAQDGARALGIWRGIALFAALAWLLTIAAWVASARYSRRMGHDLPEKHHAGEADARRAFRKAGNPVELHHALLAWGRAREPGLRNLGDLANRLGDSAQRQAIGALTRHRYAAAATDALDLDAIRNPFRRGLAWQSPPRDVADSGHLPPLYPAF